MSSLYILDTNPTSSVWFTIIFSHSVGCFLLCWWCPLMFKSFQFWWNPICFFLCCLLCWSGMFWLHLTNATNLNRNCVSGCKEKFRSRPRSDMVRSTNYNDAISTLSFSIVSPDFLLFFFFIILLQFLMYEIWNNSDLSLTKR